jgi:hypothetical protein
MGTIGAAGRSLIRFPDMPVGQYHLAALVCKTPCARSDKNAPRIQLTFQVEHDMTVDRVWGVDA